MSHYAYTPRMANPRLVPVNPPPPVVYTTVSTPSPYYDPATLHRRQSMGPYPGHAFRVNPSERSRSRGHHRSSSKSHKHRRSRSTDRYGGSRHGRHHRGRSSTPSRARYTPETHYANVPSSRHRRHSYAVPDHRYRSSSRGPHRVGHRDSHYLSHRRESIGERIKRFFGIGTHKVRFVDSSGHRVDSAGRPVYAV